MSKAAPPLEQQRTGCTAPASPAELPETQVLLVSGLSGAGRSTALKALEDLGYEAVDNLPLSLLASLVRPGDRLARPLAIGVDIRTRDFAVAPLLREIDRLTASRGVAARVLFVDCDDEVLQRRFTETRRRHPLADDRPVSDGIRREREMMTPLRARADVVIDTTVMKLGDLKHAIGGHFALARGAGLAVTVISFAYRGGVPREADLDLHTGDGNLAARDIKGSLRLDTGDGTMRVDGLHGTLRFHTGDGRIEGSGLDGEMDADTGDGDIVVSGRFEQLAAHSGDGNIELTVENGSRMAGPWNVRTGDGHVRMRLPSDFSADLDAHTGDGRINFDFTIAVSGSLNSGTIRGKLGNGGQTLSVRSGDGSIYIEKL